MQTRVGRGRKRCVITSTGAEVHRVYGQLRAGQAAHGFVVVRARRRASLPSAAAIKQPEHSAP